MKKYIAIALFGLSASVHAIPHSIVEVANDNHQQRISSATVQCRMFTDVLREVGMLRLEEKPIEQIQMEMVIMLTENLNAEDMKDFKKIVNISYTISNQYQLNTIEMVSDFTNMQQSECVNRILNGE